MDDQGWSCDRVGLGRNQPYCRDAVALARARQQQSLAISDALLLLRDHRGCRGLGVQEGKREPLAKGRTGFIERSLIMRRQLLNASFGLRDAVRGEPFHVHRIGWQLFSETRQQILNLLDSKALFGDRPTPAE